MSRSTLAVATVHAILLTSIIDAYAQDDQKPPQKIERNVESACGCLRIEDPRERTACFRWCYSTVQQPRPGPFTTYDYDRPSVPGELRR
jgi:hypothetical protein